MYLIYKNPVFDSKAMCCVNYSCHVENKIEKYPYNYLGFCLNLSGLSFDKWLSKCALESMSNLLLIEMHYRG
jgi:hypothetical protein